MKTVLCWVSVLLIVLFISTIVEAGDAFVKGGIIMRPSEGIDLSNRWLISFGSDYRLADSFTLGFEVESAYYKEGDLHLVPLFVTPNLKYKFSRDKSLKPFVGFGVGMHAYFFANGDFDSTTDAGMQIMGGVEYGRGKRLLLELKYQKTFADESEYRIIFYGGLGF